MSNALVIAAIDPGITGAIAYMTHDPDGMPVLLDVRDMPTAQAKVGKSLKSHIQTAILVDLLRTPPTPFHDRPAMVVIERVSAMPGQGVTSMFRFGHTAGLIEGVATGLQLPVHFMRPQEWQKVAKVPQGDDAGRLRVCQLFPQQQHLFARKKDHNRADAALIGYAFLMGLRIEKILT
jgi:crossover junction endodeoxyribonuclease RuvC